jgi:hypothetical protein
MRSPPHECLADPAPGSHAQREPGRDPGACGEPQAFQPDHLRTLPRRDPRVKNFRSRDRRSAPGVRLSHRRAAWVPPHQSRDSASPHASPAHRCRATRRRRPWRAADPQAADRGPTHGLDDPAAVREPERLPGDGGIHAALLPSLEPRRCCLRNTEIGRTARRQAAESNGCARPTGIQAKDRSGDCSAHGAPPSTRGAAALAPAGLHAQDRRALMISSVAHSTEEAILDPNRVRVWKCFESWDAALRAAGFSPEPA